jgi:1,4-alpha-glucan branching enzyme
LLKRAEAMAAEAEQLLATTTTLIGPRNGRPLPPTTEAPATTATPAEVDRKIEGIYGVRQTPEGVLIRGHHPDAACVQLAGEFNEWTPSQTPMRRTETGDFETTLTLEPGQYRYRLVIDGRWSHDPANPALELNEFGELNSIITVS